MYGLATGALNLRVIVLLCSCAETTAMITTALLVMAVVMTTRIGIAKSVTCPYDYITIATDIGSHYSGFRRWI